MWDGDPPAPVKRPEQQTEEDRLRARIAELEEERRQPNSPDAIAHADDGQGGDYDGLKADELRAELEGRGLPTSGTKAELVERLRADDEAK